MYLNKKSSFKSIKDKLGNVNGQKVAILWNQIRIIISGLWVTVIAFVK